MNEKYFAAAQEASTETEAANKMPSSISHKRAAGLHFVAEIQARAVGLGDEMAMHAKQGALHMQAMKACDEGKVVTTVELQAANNHEKKVESQVNPLLAKHNAAVAESLQARFTGRMLADQELQASIKDGGYSFTDLQEKLRVAVCNLPMFQPDPQKCGCPWIADIVAPEHEQGETWEAVVSGPDGKLYCVEFTIGDNGVELDGQPQEVERITDYEYVYQPPAEVGAKQAAVETPETIKARQAAETQAIEAGRAARYKNAAMEAQQASSRFAKAHADAASLHSIAAEHARMNGMGAEADSHMEKYRAHMAACEACKAGGMCPPAEPAK